MMIEELQRRRWIFCRLLYYNTNVNEHVHGAAIVSVDIVKHYPARKTMGINDGVAQLHFHIIRRFNFSLPLLLPEE